MYPITMTVEQWVAVKDNPRQRDTTRRANRAVSYLSTPLATHAICSAAVLPGGEMYKLDAHSRALLWSQNRIPVPSTITVLVFPAENLAEIKKLYDTYDNRKATKTVRDELFGAQSEGGFVFTSSLLTTGCYVSAFKISTQLIRGNSPFSISLLQDIPVIDTLREWERELYMLDDLDPPRTNYMSSAIIIAALITLRIRGESVLPFWREYIYPRPDTRIQDPAELLRRTLDGMRGKKQTGGHANMISLAGKAVYCVEKFLAGNNSATTYGRIVRTPFARETNLVKYIARFKQS